MTDPDQSGQPDYDLIVVGGGGAGLSAAVQGAQAGLTVLVCEAEDGLGGSTQLSAGLVTAAGTAVQRSLGIDDSAARMYQHYMDLNSWQVLPGPTRMFCEESAALIDWLRDLGVDIPDRISHSAHEPGLCRAGVEDAWRGHVPADQGFGLIQVLERTARRLGVEILLRSRVRDLLIADGRVRGVRVDDVDVRAPAVVVATGGLASNAALVQRFFPDAGIAGESLFVVAAPGSRGDHIGLAERYGLGLFGEGWGLLLVTAEFQRQHHWQSGFPPPSRIHVDRAGQRCMDEDAPYSVSPGILKLHGGWVWAVFDDAARRSLPAGYSDWDTDRISEEVARGVVRQGSTLPELAAAMGVPEDNLVTSVERWNEVMGAGHDPDFLRHETLRSKGMPATLEPIATGPFHAVRMLPAELVCTHTGLRVDDRARVIDVRGEVVPGLYAAGEAAGGILGERYVGGGNSVAHALVLGRVAATHAARTIREREVEEERP